MEKQHHWKGRKQSADHLSKRVVGQVVTKLLKKLRALREGEARQKKCIQCGEVKPLSAYSSAKFGMDGRRTNCKECHRKQHAKWRIENAEYDKERGIAWRDKNRERIRAEARRKHHENKEKRHADNKKWRDENKEYNRERAKIWRAKNPARITLAASKRRTRKRNAMPPWLTPFQQEKMLAIYEEAQAFTRETGIEHHVDHIYPLYGVDDSGRHVSCGLHVPWNLQVLLGAENIAKKSRNPKGDA